MFISSNRKIRVAHHLNQLGLGGTEKTVELFCKYMDKEVFDVFVIVRYAVPDSRTGNIREILGEDRVIFYNNDFVFLGRLLDEMQFDIVHVHRAGWPEPPINNFEKIREVPVIIETNIFGYEDRTPEFTSVNKSLYVSDWLKRCKARRFDVKAVALFNPIELPATSSSLRSELGVDKDRFVVGRIGRPDDSIYDPISLMAYSQMENDGTLFLVMAAPPKMKIDALGLGVKNILFLDPTVNPAEISKFYNTIDVLAHARKDGETFGCVIAEAFMHGKPAISHYSHIMNAQCELVEHGINGFIAPVDDPSQYAVYLRSLEYDKKMREQMSDKAREKALQYYEASLITKKLENIYLEELANIKKGGEVKVTEEGSGNSQHHKVQTNMPVKKVAVIYNDTAQPYTTGTYCLRALQNICDIVHYLPSQLNNIPKDSFDLYLNIDDGTKYVLPQHLKPAAWWVIDTHMQYDWDREKAYYFDLVFAAQKDGAEKLRKAGVKNVSWLPLACDPETHAKIDTPKRFDWCFVGHINCKERAELIELLKGRFPNCFVGQTFGKDMAEIFSASRIVFNRSIRNDVNMRVFEALSAGSLLITNDLKDNGLEELLQEGKDYVAYRSSEELMEKVAYYLEHEDEREKIAGHGRETALSRHTYRHRMPAILNQMEQITERKRNPLSETGTSYFQFARPELLELVPEGVRKVLDIGCAAGELGAGIKREHGAEVIGVELNPSVAEMARQKIDQVVSGDCEKMDFSSIFNGARFDCVILADILEHLRAPEDLLRKIKPLLGEGACIIASIPNVQNYTVVAGLIEGNWTYQDMGILDRTHLRFFTRREIEKLFASAGFFIEKITPKYDPTHYSWVAAGLPNNLTFGSVAVNGLPIERVADFFVFQYLIVARPMESEAGKESVKPL